MTEKNIRNTAGIITFHRASNYGAVLQTYALQRTLNKIGIESEVIDYRSKFIEDHYKPLNPFKIKDYKKLAAILIKNATAFQNRELFKSFVSKNIKLSNKTYYSQEELYATNKIYSTFITGSDQVWSYQTAGFDKAYFLKFVTDNKKKFSYSASFGVDKIPTQYTEEYESLLKNFNKISVRESQGASLVKVITSRDCNINLDPTLLLEKKEWEEIATTKLIPKKKYLLIYLISEDNNLINKCRIIAKNKNLEILYINDRLYKKFGVGNISKVPVTEWIGLFLNAEIVVTNSFHGIAFSINFNKEFYYDFLPEPAKVNSRIKHIIEIFKLKSRNIKNNNFENPEIKYNSKINWIEIEKIHRQLKEESFNYLDSIKRSSEAVK